jgi:hypothetical protein
MDENTKTKKKEKEKRHRKKRKEVYKENIKREVLSKMGEKTVVCI